MNAHSTPRSARRAARALKPRNPILAALKANQGARAGVHQKSRGALRRAGKMALGKALGDEE